MMRRTSTPDHQQNRNHCETDPKLLNNESRTLIARAAAGKRLTPSEIASLLTLEAEADFEFLLHTADRVRGQAVGDAVHLRAIIEFSNYCRCRCGYCGLNAANRSLKRYRMSPEEILETARRASDLGLRTIVLQSGEDTGYSTRKLCEVIRRLKQETGTAITLSIGERSGKDYAAFREAGADRYLLKHETADPELYHRMHPGTSLVTRLDNLRYLQKLGYQVGTGCIVGLPGQTTVSLVEDILLIRELEVDMAGIGPFIPHSATKLGGYPSGSLKLTLKMLAVARLALPRVHLPATTALSTLHPEGLHLGLTSGANVVMLDATPAVYRQYYDLYPRPAAGELVNRYHQVVALIQCLERRIAEDRGDSYQNNRFYRD